MQEIDRPPAYPFCAGADPDIFFDDQHPETAKAYCQRCPVVEWCLAVALAVPYTVGVWGGTTEDERRALKRGGNRKTCPGCGGGTIYSDGLSEICVDCGLSWLT